MLVLGGVRLRGAAADRPPLQIDAAFPGGNILVDRIEGDRVHVRQDLRDTQGWWFYWYFRVRGAEGKTLAFEFKERALGPLGPAVSRDGGRTWHWSRQRESATVFKHTFGPQETEVRFSFAMPYQHADLVRFLARHAGNPHLRVETSRLTTRRGTPVETLWLGPKESPAFKVWITCRHHACEMMASYALEGLIDEALSDSEEGKWLRRTTEFLIVPMVDKDGVEAGDQGKNRAPRDHGADYVGPSIYPEVAALRALVRTWAGGRPDVTLDLHNPSINHRVIYTHALRAETNGSPWQNAHAPQQTAARRFLDLLERTRRGPLPFRVQDSLDFAAKKAAEPGAAKNRGGEPPAEGAAAPAKPGSFRCTFELPYALAGDVEVNADSARAFGRDIARALAVHLQQSVPPAAAP